MPSVKKRVVFISTFPPRRCGIATFTSDLIESVSGAADDQFEPLVVAMQADGDLRYTEPVRFEIRQNVRSDYICAADYINFSHVDLISVQHEFGLFGGPAGSYLGLLLKRLKAPILTTLHTVLHEPTPDYHRSLVDVCDCSDRVITMNERGVTMLREIYGIAPRRIRLIPHGIPDLPFVDSNYYKAKFGLEGRKTILTFGLISKNKGIEVMLRAMRQIVSADQSVMYLVLGMTHPAVLKAEGESYRFGLQQLVKDLDLQDHVIFHNRFVDDDELHNFLCATDIYVTPYLGREQLTSGTLAFAVGSGKAVVSTPYWAATELLADGRGRLVPFGDATSLAGEIIDILHSDGLFYSLRRNAYDYGRARTWPKIGQVYWKLFDRTRPRLPVTSIGRTSLRAGKTLSTIDVGAALATPRDWEPVPEPALDHLSKLTDDTGLFQHARFTIPNRAHGYCTDDNARGAIAMVKYYTQYRDPQALRLLDIYLAFLMYAQNPDGSMRNFLDFNRRWWDNEPRHDGFGRALWALGTVLANPPSPAYLAVMKDCFDRATGHVQHQSLRGLAYCILGLCEYLKQFPGASDIKRHVELAAGTLVDRFRQANAPRWTWFEDSLTYDNAVLPHALYVAGLTLAHEEYFDVAIPATDFLLETTCNSDHFSFIGTQGWYERGQARAAFDQQPVEAAAMVMMLRSAYDATKEIRYLNLQRTAFDWFLGTNDLRLPLYDFRTKGCSDGLMTAGVNGNQGAESMVSFLLSLLAIVESCAMADKPQDASATPSALLIPYDGSATKQDTVESQVSKPR